jgi:hypothetical protein
MRTLPRIYTPRRKPPFGTALDRIRPLARDLLVYAALNEGGGNRLNDLSGSGNGATLSGGVSWGASPNGSALSFNGASSNVNGRSPFGGLPRATWYVRYLQGPANQGTTNGYFCSHTGYNAGFFIGNYNGGNAQVWIGNTTVNVVVTPGVWTDLVVVYDQPNIWIYVDGVLGGTSTSAPTSVPAHTSYDVGSQNGQYWLSGGINCYAGWGHVLTLGEVRALSAAPFQVFERPRAYWAMTPVGGGGAGNASASPAGLTVTAPGAVASGTAQAPAAVATLTLAAPSVTASGTGMATTGVASLTLAAPSVAATGTGSAAPAAATLTLTAQAATATGTGTAGATPAALTLTAQPATASAGGSGTASASPASLVLTAPTVSAMSNATATAAPASLTITAPPAAASAGGSATVSVSPASLLLAAQVVAATGNAIAGAMPATLALTPGAAAASGVTTAIVAAVTLTLAAQAVAVRADASVVVTAATLLLTAQGMTAGGAGTIPYRTYVAGRRQGTYVAGTLTRTFTAGKS